MRAKVESFRTCQVLLILTFFLTYKRFFSKIRVCVIDVRDKVR